MVSHLGFAEAWLTFVAPGGAVDLWRLLHSGLDHVCLERRKRVTLTSRLGETSDIGLF